MMINAIKSIALAFFLGLFSYSYAETDYNSLSMEELEALPKETIEQLPLVEIMVNKKALPGANEDLYNAMIMSYLSKLHYHDYDSETVARHVKKFQSQLGTKADGVIKMGEWDKLMERAGKVQLTPVYVVGGPSIHIYKGYALATGTWEIVGEKIANPINQSRITCEMYSDGGLCSEVISSVYIQDESYSLHQETGEYKVLSWSDNTIVARAGGPNDCRHTTLTLNQKTEEVSAITTNNNKEGCALLGDQKLPLLESPRLSRFAKDGFKVTYGYFESLKKETNQYLNPEWQKMTQSVQEAEQKRE